MRRFGCTNGRKNGKDVLVATGEVVSSPAMTSLAPGQQQLVRIIVMQPGIRAQEQSYRLVIDELPDATSRAANPTAVHFLLRYSIPVFIAGNQSAPVSHDALSCEQSEIPATLRCFNAGNRHIRLSHLEALTADGQVVGSIKGPAGYVLPDKPPFCRLNTLHVTRSARCASISMMTTMPARYPCARSLLALLFWLPLMLSARTEPADTVQWLAITVNHAREASSGPAGWWIMRYG